MKRCIHVGAVKDLTECDDTACGASGVTSSANHGLPLLTRRNILIFFLHSLSKNSYIQRQERKTSELTRGISNSRCRFRPCRVAFGQNSNFQFSCMKMSTICSKKFLLIFSIIIWCSTQVHSQSPTIQPDSNNSTSSPDIETNAPAMPPVAVPVVTTTPVADRVDSLPPEATPAPTTPVNVTTPVPTVFVTPTVAPSTQTPSLAPSSSPRPSLSFQPSDVPSSSWAPSPQPSEAPSVHPSFELISNARGFYRQGFVIAPEATDSFFNMTETEILVTILEGYTDRLGESKPDQVTTECLVSQQIGIPIPETNLTTNEVDYECSYSSGVSEVNALPGLFITYVNSNLTGLTLDLQAEGLEVTASNPVSVRIVQSPAPSASPVPSAAPTLSPTASIFPSALPSVEPSMRPSVQDLPTVPPILGPSILSTPQPTLQPITPPSKRSGGTLEAGAIAAIVILVGLAFLAALYFYYRSWKKKRAEPQSTAINTSTVPSTQPAAWPSFRNQSQEQNWNNGQEVRDDLTNRNVVISPTESLMSHKSLISAGESGLGDESENEHDGTKNLQDEFDQYKDQNLEQLRANVEDSIPGFEGIMSAAVTNALMGNEEANVEMQELLWGCDPQPAGTEIEASALFEVCDWLKRNESAPPERKRSFMQEILNKMVTSVRFGVLRADDASRAIHESAAILGLPLAEELPMTTVIISGMRKTTTAEDMINAMSDFGEIDAAAIASGRRGFGILRFRRYKSVDRALKRYKSGEIVILDVSIQMQVLMPSGVVESR